MCILGDFNTVEVFTFAFTYHLRDPKKHIKTQRHYFAKKDWSSQSYVFPVVMYGCESWTIKLSAKELMLFNCGVGKDSLESLGLQGDPTSPS